MTAEDVPEVHRIEEECFSQPWSEKAFYEELENPYGRTLVAVLENKAAGFINVRSIGGEIYINNIAVSGSFRRKGVGDGLLSALEKASEAYEFITLEVRQSNIPAIRLYEKHGFRQVGKRKNFYEKPTEDAILMTKDRKDAE